MAKSPDGIEILELWRLPMDFFKLSLEEQWKAMAEVSRPAKPTNEKRQPCPMVWTEQLEAMLWMSLCFGLPLSIVPVSVLLAFTSRRALGSWLATLAFLGLHPLAPYSMEARRRRIGLIMARYFSFIAVVDRQDPLQGAYGTPTVDKLEKPFPIVPLACPHGVINFGATIWVYFERWLNGVEQYTAAATAVQYIPGLRYLIQPLWFVPVDRASLKRHLQERPTETRPRGGCVGVVPDGIAGIFHSKPGTDILHIGKKRGLMRIGLEEGTTFGAGWFAGTSDCFTIVQDPFGMMRWVSRKLALSFFLFYGRWGLPIPRRSPTTLIMKVTRLEKTTSPTEEQVQAAHKEVYGGLVDEFERLKHFVGLSDRTLVVT